MREVKFSRVEAAFQPRCVINEKPARRHQLTPLKQGNVTPIVKAYKYTIYRKTLTLGNEMQKKKTENNQKVCNLMLIEESKSFIYREFGAFTVAKASALASDGSRAAKVRSA